jgi:hypothetical protein
MQIAQQDFAATYRDLSDDDIAALFAEIDTLTDTAKAALALEVQRRGLSSEQLLKLRTVELRLEAHFDRREKFRRKRLFLSRLGLDDYKGWIFAIVAGLILALIKQLISHHH